MRPLFPGMTCATPQTRPGRVSALSQDKGKWRRSRSSGGRRRKRGREEVNYRAGDTELGSPSPLCLAASFSPAAHGGTAVREDKGDRGSINTQRESARPRALRAPARDGQTDTGAAFSL
ncbi:hypothetical protein KIL84_000727 [Mauremys mutica]|uniref:Uncharacterized protein n=1 Tax=Mauremys mutica TaxID=74926 RepID=A0A9D3WZ45_9SAUR|nr:hypothetical protein KIL84_000727 [Mauremys mutica]